MEPLAVEIGARFLDRWGHGRSPVRAPAWTEIREREEAAGPFYGTLIPFGRDQFFFPLLLSLSLLFLNERTVLLEEKNSIPPGFLASCLSIVFASIFRGISIFLEYPRTRLTIHVRSLRSSI